MRLLFPSVPTRIFNGVLVESEPCSGIADSIWEVEERGVPCGLQLRAGRHPVVEQEASQLGLTERIPLPGMTASPQELADARVPGLVIVRAEDEEGLAEAAQVSAAVGDVPLELKLAVFARGLLRLPGFAVYVGRVGGEPVTMAMGYQTGADIAIFNVGTPPRHRRRRYGAAITAYAAQEGFADGADLAWLQTSEIGESVYRRLGFRHEEMHFMLGRPRAARRASTEQT